MTEIIDVKKEFLENFQLKILQARRLLSDSNHKWADKLFNELYFEIQKSEWMDVQKKNQLIVIIINSWHLYINSLTKKDENQLKLDPIKFLDAYNRFFTLLSRLDDFYHFSMFFTNLLKSFITMENLSKVGITKYINSYCNHVYARQKYLDLIELQILLMYLRKSVLPTDLFIFSMENLSKIVLKLKPDKRALFINIFLETTSIRFELMEGQEFVRLISKLLVNRLPSSLKTEFGNLTKISINQRTFPTILIDLEELIQYLSDIGEQSWIIMIVRYMYSKINEYQSFPEAITHIRAYIDFLIDRSHFEEVFDIYDFMEDLFIYKSDLGYSNVLIELWIEACKKFLSIKEKKFLLQSLNKLNTHLKIPRTNEQLFHFFYTCNYLWQFKSLYYSLEAKDFWRMVFYRAFFEEKDFSLSTRIIPFLDKNLQPLLNNLNQLYDDAQSFKKEIYHFDLDEDYIIPSEGKISKIIIHVNSWGLISFKMIVQDNMVVEGKIKYEIWNDTQLGEIYENLFSFSQDEKLDLNLAEFGCIYYLSLPKIIRSILSRLHAQKENEISQIHLILDSMILPFELIHANQLLLLQCAISYRIGELDIGGTSFEQKTTRHDAPCDVLIIKATNNLYPTSWNDKKQVKELIYPFNEANEELDHIINFFKSSEHVNTFNILTESTCNRENIFSNLSKNKLDIIHFIGNIHYSTTSPKDSYFILEDKNIIKIEEFLNAIKKNPNKICPFIFIESQLFDNEGVKINNTVKILGELFSHLDYTYIKGIIGRIFPLFTNETREIISDFYRSFLNKQSQGISLLKAISKDRTKKEIQMHQRVSLTSFMLFGRSWDVL